MKKFFPLSVAVYTLAIIFISCKDDKGSNPEFIADASTFAGFSSWTVLAVDEGPDPALGPAHAGNDETVTRTVYIKENHDLKDGSLPVGTVIVKHTTNPDKAINEFTAMVKRGDNFNEGFGDWEFFMLNEDGEIGMEGGAPLRGAALLNGACRNCHSQASASDFIFSK